MWFLVAGTLLVLGGITYIYYADVWAQPVCYGGN